MLYIATLLLGTILLTAGPEGEVRAFPDCQYTPRGWCPGVPGDPCGAHANEALCRADKRCAGLPYQGESFVACLSDGHGFASNCPAVGCRMAPAHPAGRPTSPTRP